MEPLNMPVDFDIKSEPGMLMISTSNGSTVDSSFFVNALEGMAQSNLVPTNTMVSSEPSTPNASSQSAVVVVQPVNGQVPSSPLLSPNQTATLITERSSVTMVSQPALNVNPLQSPTVTAAVQSSPTSVSDSPVLETSCPSSSAGTHFTQPGEGSLVVADSNTPKQVFVPCKVCGDKASGYHYGVTSCEGCKGFFRRSIQKQIEYRCLRDGKCLVMRLNRNRCQYCRFKKCLAVGMSRDSVRYGRVPKRSRSLDEQRVTTTGDSPPAAAPSGAGDVLQESRQLAMYDIILTMSQAHHANCLTTEDKVKNLNKKPISLLDKLDMASSPTNVVAGNTSLDGHRSRVFENLASLVTPVINLVVSFAKQVPGFGDLSQDDQLILIKTGFFEIWLTRMVRMLNTTENTVMFGDGSLVSRTELELVYSPELVGSMFSFAKGFVSLRLNDTEIGIFTGVVLATPDRQGLSDKKAVEVTQDRLIEALKLQITRNHALEPNLFASILMKIPELRTLGSKHNEQLAWFRKNWLQLNLPPLYAEIYDIPRLDNELLTASDVDTDAAVVNAENYTTVLQ